MVQKALAACEPAAPMCDGWKREHGAHITSRRIRDKEHPEHAGENQAASNYGYLPSRTYLLKHRKTLQQFSFSNATSWVGINAVL